MPNLFCLQTVITELITSFSSTQYVFWKFIYSSMLFNLFSIYFLEHNFCKKEREIFLPFLLDLNWSWKTNLRVQQEQCYEIY